MANTRRAHDDEAWTNAKKICRLNARQVEMARALGMNPRKLPGLRPSAQQRWTLPVGEFIEEPMTAIPVPPLATRRGLSRRGAQERIFDDDEIPF